MNKPQKQTVYLPKNGSQEKYVLSDNDAGYFNGVVEQEGYFFTPEQLNEYTANVIKQALEIAVEFAKWIAESGAYPCITPRNKGLYVLDPCDPKDYTPEEMFQEFLKTKQYEHTSKF